MPAVAWNTGRAPASVRRTMSGIRYPVGCRDHAPRHPDSRDAWHERCRQECLAPVETTNLDPARKSSWLSRLNFSLRTMASLSDQDAVRPPCSFVKLSPRSAFLASLVLICIRRIGKSGSPAPRPMTSVTGGAQFALPGSIIGDWWVMGLNGAAPDQRAAFPTRCSSVAKTSIRAGDGSLS